MNIFRLAGDMTHLASVLVLLLKIHTIKSCAGRYPPSLPFQHSPSLFLRLRPRRFRIE
ncbi:ER lumen protein retaining receptor [Vigna unguiculata]|uniref:ER lumen protein retaining receptor n=1 Tax=Vigna unguiculata TaxID=3917 RepID=A0A4D6NFQ4_VIGUN|nr:ER lumen protein retaining receptor [Vigna unguiculata]